MNASAVATWATVISFLLVALIGAVWRVGSKVGSIASTLADHEGRLDRVEQHQDAHDTWHMSKGLV